MENRNIRRKAVGSDFGFASRGSINRSGYGVSAPGSNAISRSGFLKAVGTGVAAAGFAAAGFGGTVKAQAPETPGSNAMWSVPDDFPTIQEAVDMASSGDTIMIMPGTYQGFSVDQKSLKIVGSGIETIINDFAPYWPVTENYEPFGEINGGTACIVIYGSNASGTEISNLSINCTNINVFDGIVIYPDFEPPFESISNVSVTSVNIICNGQNPRPENVEPYWYPRYDIGIEIYSGRNIQLTHNNISGFPLSSLYYSEYLPGYPAVGIFITYSTDSLVAFNKIKSLPTDTPLVLTGIGSLATDNVKIVHNKVVVNSTSSLEADQANKSAILIMPSHDGTLLTYNNAVGFNDVRDSIVGITLATPSGTGNVFDHNKGNLSQNISNPRIPASIFKPHLPK